MSKAILGIDVGKYEFAVALLKDGKFTDKVVENNQKGFQQILKFLENKAPKAEVYLEATGRYGEEVTDFLSSKGFDVKVINPAQIRDFARAKLARHKTGLTQESSRITEQHSEAEVTQKSRKTSKN